jgi:uncharacterized protein Yka (UPF0111/DUF47 family)
MGLQDVVRWLVPREHHFYGLLEAQAKVAHKGAVALRRFHEGDSAAQVREAVQAVEHEGDRIAREMEDALARTFVTPIDREDLQKLSVELDDILDLANGAIRVAVLNGVERPTRAMGELMVLLTRCTEILEKTIPNLRRSAYATITHDCRELRELEKKADTVFREAVSKLFHDAAVDAKQLLRERAVLDDLENAIDHCELVAKSLAHLAVKHG